MATTLVELRKVASDLKIAGRSKMGKTDLVRAIAEVMDTAHAEALEIDAQRDKIARDFNRANAISPMSNTDRRKHYFRQTGRGYLTARQERRIRKHSHKHGHGTIDIMSTIDLDFADSFERSL